MSHKFARTFTTSVDTADEVCFCDNQLVTGEDNLTLNPEAYKSTNDKINLCLGTGRIRIYEVCHDFISKNGFDFFLVFTQFQPSKQKPKHNYIASNWQSSLFDIFPLDDIVGNLDIPLDASNKSLGEENFSYKINRDRTNSPHAECLDSFLEFLGHGAGFGYYRNVGISRKKRLFVLFGRRHYNNQIVPPADTWILSEISQYIQDSDFHSFNYLPKLSKRELECIQWISDGKTSFEIGIILDLSENTINNYIASASKKIGAVNRAHLVSIAIRNRLIC